MALVYTYTYISNDYLSTFNYTINIIMLALILIVSIVSVVDRGCNGVAPTILLNTLITTTKDYIMSRYTTPVWKELVSTQNELSEYAPVDILTITGFMKTEAQLIKHLNENKALLNRYRASKLR